MKAMVYRGPGRVRVEEKDIPKIEHPNDAIVRVSCAAICGSDLHLFHGMMPDLRVGHTFGHEFVGFVHEVGPSVENLRVNLAEQGYDLDRVTYVVQYNKRDLPNAVALDELHRLVNPRGVPEFQAVAPTGVGVFDTLKAVAKLVLTELKRGA